LACWNVALQQIFVSQILSRLRNVTEIEERARKTGKASDQ
jgi:hypothetical protein